MRSLRIALAQINTTVGDLAGNVDRVLAGIEQARAAEAQLVVFPELTVTGYPPEDLLLKPRFIADNRRALDRLLPATEGLVAVVGFVDCEGDLFNAAAVLHDGQLVGVHRKCYLPNYGVFDEERYFAAGHRWQVFDWGGLKFAVNICEDLWYPGGPLHDQAVHGDAELIVNISASPYHKGKGAARERLLATRAADHAALIAYCNLVGGQDELIFDGQSLVVEQHGDVVARGAAFVEDLVVAELDLDAVFRQRLHDPRRRKEKNASAGAPIDRVTLPGSPVARHPIRNSQFAIRNALPWRRRFTPLWCSALAITCARMASRKSASA